MTGHLFGGYSRNMESADGAASNRRQRLPYSPTGSNKSYDIAEVYKFK